MGGRGYQEKRGFRKKIALNKSYDFKIMEEKWRKKVFWSSEE